MLKTKLHFILVFSWLMLGGVTLQGQNKPSHPRPKIGDIAPDISLNSPTGKTYTLSDLQGQFVLIDFWAAWCAPCRKENRKLVKVYGKFKQAGFTVFSVSLDESKEAWEGAIAIDGINQWPYHVSELKGFESDVAIQYRVDYLPDNYLIDKTGKIIAVDLKVNELEKILKRYIANR